MHYKEGTALDQTLEKSDLTNIRNRLFSLQEQLLDLEQMMSKLADETFGSRPEMDDRIDSKAAISENTTLQALFEIEKTIGRLRNQCNRF